MTNQPDKRAAQILAAKWRTDPVCGDMIWAIDPFGSGDDFYVADIRGHGHLTGQGSLRMSEADSGQVQDTVAAEIVRLHNANLDEVQP